MSSGSAPKLLLGWEVMVMMMMLPSSVRFIRLFVLVTSANRGRGVYRTTVIAGYALAWAAAGCVVFAVSGATHRVSGIDSWLQHHAGLFAGFVLMLAGTFQLTALKRGCLAVCSHPHSFLMRHYHRGAFAALDLGARYGIMCVGCCWALMALAVVLGAGSPYAMIVLGVVMFAERALGWNDRFARAVGLVCVVLGAVAAVSPGAVPALADAARMWSETGAAQMHGLMFWCHA
jgi:predicted metal-binding membrane protein